MKRKIKIAMLLGISGVYGILGAFLVYMIWVSDKGKYVVLLMLYFGLLCMMGKTKFFQNHVMTNVRGGGIVSQN